ncbi:MAG: hypothetical protein IKJ65_05665 [Clostridia bacterium]|nr:hypothetical protein [Clostridia bacterium]
MFSRIENHLKKRFDSDQFTYEQLRNMFFPLVMDQLFIFIIGMLSSAMVSSSHEGAAASVMLVNVIGSLAYALFSAISMGGAIVVARAKGANDPERVRQAIGQAANLSLIVSSLLAFLLYIGAERLILFLYPDAEEIVISSAVTYMKVYVLSFPVYAVFNVLFSSFRSLGDAKSSLVLTIVINVAHLIFSFIFINHMHLATLGAALSYLTARILGMIFGFIWLFRPHNGVDMRVKHFFHFSLSIIKEIRVLGIPFAFEQLLFQGGMLFVQRYLSHLPTAELDAYSIAASIFNLYYAFAYAMTAMAGTVCGQCVGAKHIELARKYAKDLIWAGRWVMIFAIVVLMPLTPLILNLYSPSQAARPIIFISLMIGALPMPVLWGEGYIIPAATRTAGDASFTSVISLIALACGRMSSGYLFAITLKMGVQGVWLGQLIEWIIRAAVMTKRIKTDKWIRIR